jgi:arylsulfatase A-like enzyme
LARPNLLFILTEQQQAQTTEPGSQCQMPALNRLAAQGIRFTRAYTVNAICSPARASLFTGALPTTHGMVDCTHTVEPYRAEFDSSLETWSQRLQALGYRTGFFGKWHVERTNRLENFGWDEYELTGSPQFTQYRRGLGLPDKPADFSLQHWVRHKGYRDFLLYGAYDEPAEGTSEHYLVSRGMDFISRAAGDGAPWCVCLSVTAVHDPYLVPTQYYRRYDPDSITKPANHDDDLAARPGIYRRMRSVWRDMTWRNYAEATACYYGFCSLVDDQVDRILCYLEETGQAENTIIIYCTDHGEMMGAHGLMHKGVFPFEEGYRIPLIVHWPGHIPAGTTCERLVNTHDLAPTIVDMVGAEPLPRSEGRSLAPLLQGRTPEGWVDEAYAEFQGQRFAWTQRIVWEPRFKYVFNGFDYDELYDLEADPHEMNNLAQDPAYADVAERMAARMWARAKATGDHNLYNAQYPMFRFAPVGPESEDWNPAAHESGGA